MWNLLNLQVKQIKQMLEDKKTNSQIMGTLQAGNPIKGTKLKHIVQQIIRFRKERIPIFTG